MADMIHTDYLLETTDSVSIVPVEYSCVEYQYIQIRENIVNGPTGRWFLLQLLADRSGHLFYLRLTSPYRINVGTATANTRVVSFPIPDVAPVTRTFSCLNRLVSPHFLTMSSPVIGNVRTIENLQCLWQYLEYTDCSEVYMHLSTLVEETFRLARSFYSVIHLMHRRASKGS